MYRISKNRRPYLHFRTIFSEKNRLNPVRGGVKKEIKGFPYFVRSRGDRFTLGLGVRDQGKGGHRFYQRQSGDRGDRQRDAADYRSKRIAGHRRIYSRAEIKVAKPALDHSFDLKKTGLIFLNLLNPDPPLVPYILDSFHIFFHSLHFKHKFFGLNLQNRIDR